MVRVIWSVVSGNREPRGHSVAGGEMSFLHYKRCIAEGDTVIVCRGRERSFPMCVTRGKVIQVKGGAVHHDYVIGKEYGSKILTSNSKSWVILLHPTPELWTLTLPHRTQILYSTDISLLSLQLDLRPGAVVVESGTGSGSLSHAIARTVAPNGHLYTFEFHKQRAEMAREEFTAHGLAEVVTLFCRDVCKDGFDLENVADAVFLDLPNPWEAVNHAKKAIKLRGGRLCSFSPCIEQVQRTCLQLKECGFVDVEVVECLLRPYNVHQFTLNIPNIGFSSNPSSSSSSSSSATPLPQGTTGEQQSCDGHMTDDPQPSGSIKLTRPKLKSVTFDAAQPTKTAPGHTGFLTFATLNCKPHPHSSTVSFPGRTDTDSTVTSESVPLSS